MFINPLTIGCTLGIVFSTTEIARTIIKSNRRAKEESRSHTIELNRMLRKNERDRRKSIENNIHNQIMKASGVENNIGKYPLFKEKIESIDGTKKYVYDLPLGISSLDIEEVKHRIETSENISIKSIDVYPNENEIVISYTQN